MNSALKASKACCSMPAAQAPCSLRYHFGSTSARRSYTALGTPSGEGFIEEFANRPLYLDFLPCPPRLHRHRQAIAPRVDAFGLVSLITSSGRELRWLRWKYRQLRS